MTPPDPLVPAEVDLRDMDGFMLNVERLLASELWALSDGRQLKAALSLWCRAWKQTPAASLPDDELVLAPFAGLTLAQFRKERWIILRGFVKCSDGRLYHRVLAEDALRAWAVKRRRTDERKAEAERLKRWRERRDDETRTYGVRNAYETRTKGVSSTGTGTVQSSTGTSSTSKALKPLASSASALSAGRGGKKRLNGEEHVHLKAVERIPLVGGAEFLVTESMVNEFERAYPAVDVPQTLKEIRAWCVSNPSRCKTPKGALRFVNSWLSREQNRG